MESDTSLVSLIDQLDHLTIKKQVFDQLLKDFSRAQLRLNVSVDSSIESWISELISVLGELYTTDPTRLHQLLYLIDIPQDFYVALNKLNSSDYGSYFTELVLIRTLKKISYRNQYS